MKAKRDNVFSELIAFRITKRTAKEKMGGGVRIKFPVNGLSCKKYIDRN